MAARHQHQKINSFDGRLYWRVNHSANLGPILAVTSTPGAADAFKIVASG